MVQSLFKLFHLSSPKNYENTNNNSNDTNARPSQTLQQEPIGFNEGVGT